MTYAILVHGGAGSPSHISDGCAVAVARAKAVLERGGDALAAALAATVVLEDDPRFNAGTGSNVRLDGGLVEMDAAVAASDARFGAVGCIQRVKNPVLVAAEVMRTPHLLLVGEGATAFARRRGFPDYDPITEVARAKHARAMAQLCGRGDGTYEHEAAAWPLERLRDAWNFASEPPGCDTVGAVVRDRHGLFAATASTGGTIYMLRGRVGDSPLLGAGLYAGPHGAVAATGAGEAITRKLLAKTIHDWLADDVVPQRAAQRAVALFPSVVDVGVVVVGRDGHAIASNRAMPAAHVVG